MDTSPTASSKTCTKCKVEQDVSSFAKGNGPLGRKSWCRGCVGARFKEQQAARKCACGGPLVARHRSCAVCIAAEAPPSGHKKCARCLVVKHFNGFPRDAGREDGRFSYCKMCHRAYQSTWGAENPLEQKERYGRALEKARQWKLENPKAYKDVARRASLLRRYGITPEQYGQKLEEQGGHCALCPVTPDMEQHGVLAVDHDHACCGRKKGCGRCFRFLLCFRHNAMLGMAKDDPATLRQAANLLDEWAKSKT